MDVLRRRLLGGTKRFNELLRLSPGVARFMRARQVRALGADRNVARQVDPGTPLKVEYSLTEFGKTSEPILKWLQQWGTGNVQRTTQVRNGRS